MNLRYSAFQFIFHSLLDLKSNILYRNNNCINNCQLFPNSKLKLIVSENKHSNRITLTGEIVSIYEKERNRFAKIHYEHGFVDVKLQEYKDVYLGDKVIIDSDLTIKKITPKSTEGNSN